jgi:hypothetical protein
MFMLLLLFSTTRSTLLVSRNNQNEKICRLNAVVAVVAVCQMLVLMQSNLLKEESFVLS